MKTTLKTGLSLMLVTLMINMANAQQAEFSLAAKYDSEKLNEESTSFDTEIFKEEFKDSYEDDVRVSYRYAERRRYRRGNRWDVDKYYPRRGTENFVNFYIGLSNYLEDEELPNSNSILNLNPITSFYGAINLDNITRILGPIYLDWGAGLSIQDFSFENTRVSVVPGDNEVLFVEDNTISGRKSRLTMSHLNVHFIPTLSFGSYNDFRVGLGVYAGYRIGAHTKRKFDDANGDTERLRVRDDFFLSPFRYGLRGTVGWNSFDLFLNYDVTELFDEDVTAPRLNPITFGVIL